MEHNSEEQMKLIRHGTEIVAMIEHQREKAYLISQQGKQEWVSLFPVGDTIPVAEMNTTNLQVRLCAGQTAADE